MILSGSVKQLMFQLSNLIAYYGTNARMCDVIENEQKIGG